MKVLKFFCLLFFFHCFQIKSQIKSSRVFEMDEPVFSISNKQFLVYALNKKGIADLQNNQIIDDKEILSFCLSPLGNEIITISKNKIKKYSLGETIEEVLNKKINFKSDVKKIISDQFGNKYFILFENGKLFILDKSLRTSEVNSNEKIIDVSWSDNLESVFILTKSSIKRYRNEAFFETKPLSKTASLISSINQFYRIAIGFQDGSFSIFSQNLKNEIINIKVSNSPVNSIVNHPEDPHLFVGNLLGELYSFNLLSNKLTFINKIHEREIGLRSVNSSFKNIKKEYLVSYGNDSKIKIWDIKNYEPDFKKFVDDKLEIVKNQFYKIKLNENEAEFTKRTSSDRSSKYFRVVRQNMIDSIAKTKYDENYLIEEEGDSIQLTIYPFKSISLLKSDGIFSDFLKLTNVNFEINQLNFFEIKNFNLYDQSSGKNLLFNPGLDKEIELANIEKEKRNVRIAQKISRQELSLKNELTKLVSDMQLKGEINKVDLSVNSKLVKEKDSTGTEELNLKIAFLSKGVRAEAAASTSDYAPGKYNLFDSPSAKTLVQFFLRSTKDKLYQYLVNGNRVTFKITGSTDKSRVNSALPYDNEYGPFKNVPYYSQGLLEGMNLDRYTGIKSNSELGFLRTVAVKDFIINNTDLFDLTKNKFILYSEESEKLGPEYRKVSIEMTIHSIDKLMSLEKTKNEILSDVDVNIPKTNTVLNAFALIIGNEDYASYQSGLSIGQNVPFANRDAISFKNYLMQMYNIPEKQILILVDGSLASMREKILQFKSLMDMNNDSGDNNQFIFYYSGHGMPSETTGDPFIMPVDVSAYTVDEAISLNKLLIDFSRYDKQKTTVIVDACFSGISRSPEPLIKVRGVGSKKLEKRSKNKSSNKSYFNYYKPVSYRDINYINPNIGKNMMLISSSSGDETSLTWDDKQHGLFTYFLLKSLQKSGGNISNEKLFYEVKKEVRIKSIFDFGGRKQTPEVLYGEQFKKDNQFLKND